MHENDCEGIAEAIRHIRGVCGVTKNAADMSDYIQRMQVKRELLDKMRDVLDWLRRS